MDGGLSMIMRKFMCSPPALPRMPRLANVSDSVINVQ